MERGAPVAVDTVLAALAECGDEVVVVPRGSVVTVTSRPGSCTSGSPGCDAAERERLGREIVVQDSTD